MALPLKLDLCFATNILALTISSTWIKSLRCLPSLLIVNGLLFMNYDLCIIIGIPRLIMMCDFVIHELWIVYSW